MPCSDYRKSRSACQEPLA